MIDSRFEQLVDEGIESIPERFLRRLENVAIVIADFPSKEQLSENHVPQGETLLGLYEGIPLTARGDGYGTGFVLPDKITIFKLPIVRAAHGDDAKIASIVRDTVWHEVGHYFGYDDLALQVREESGTNHSM